MMEDRWRAINRWRATKDRQERERAAEMRAGALNELYERDEQLGIDPTTFVVDAGDSIVLPDRPYFPPPNWDEEP